MTHKSFVPLIALTIAGFMAACNSSDDDYTAMDREWDAADSAYLVDYNPIRAENDRLAGEIQTMAASSDTAIAAQYTQTRARLEAQREKLQAMESARAGARTKRESARTAKDRAAYEAARKEIDYNAWKSDLDRIRSEQTELEGTIKIGNKTVGAIDANVKDTSKPLLRVEPGKKDNKPLIEMNKNPK